MKLEDWLTGIVIVAMWIVTAIAVSVAVVILAFAIPIAWAWDVTHPPKRRDWNSSYGERDGTQA